MTRHLPPEYETPYEVVDNNDDLEKGVFYYVHEMAIKYGYLLGANDQKHLLVSAIVPFLRVLNQYGYAAYWLESKKQPGLKSEVAFTVEDRNGPKVIRTRVTFVSENFDDYEKYVQGKILPRHEDSADLR